MICMSSSRSSTTRTGRRVWYAGTAIAACNVQCHKRSAHAVERSLHIYPSSLTTCCEEEHGQHYFSGCFDGGSGWAQAIAILCRESHSSTSSCDATFEACDQQLGHCERPAWMKADRVSLPPKPPPMRLVRDTILCIGTPSTVCSCTWCFVGHCRQSLAAVSEGHRGTGQPVGCNKPREGV